MDWMMYSSLQNAEDSTKPWHAA